MKFYLRRHDFMLVGLRNSPENSDGRGNLDWSKEQIIVKANIILHIGSRTQVRTKKSLMTTKKGVRPSNFLGEYLCRVGEK